jgi:hypothetical protein
MKLICKICGKEREIVSQPKDLRGKNVTAKNAKWKAVRDKEDNSLHILVCGGGLFVDDEEEQDKCLSEYLKDKDETFINSTTTEVFLPLKRLVPKDCISE